MEPVYKQFPLNRTGETFAGFTYPRRQWSLPSGPLAGRLAAAKKDRLCGPYYFNAPCPNSSSVVFYLGDMGEGSPVDLPWSWCDEIPSEWRDYSRRAVTHSGWYSDDLSSETIRGVVFKLPKGRGFLAGWSMGVGMSSELSKTEVFDSADCAAHAADDLARVAAEVEKEYQWVESLRSQLEDKLETVRRLWADAKTLSRELKNTPRESLPPHCLATLQMRLRNLRVEIDQTLSDAHDLRDQIKAAA